MAVVPLTCGVTPTFTDEPVVVKVATSAVTFVPKGTVTAMLVPVITPVAAGVVKPKAVISFAGFGPNVTVTVYVFVEASAAVTVYVTGLVKSFGVVPLTCVVAPTLTNEPVVVKVATSAVTFVPKGTVTAMLVPLIKPIDDWAVKLKAVISFAGFAATMTETI